MAIEITLSQFKQVLLAGIQAGNHDLDSLVTWMRSHWDVTVSEAQVDSSLEEMERIGVLEARSSEE